MSKIKSLGLAGLAFCFLAEQAVAYETGNSLAEKCRSSDRFQQGQCLGFIRAFSPAYILAVYDLSDQRTSMADAQRRSGFCVPQRVTFAQLVDVFLLHSENHPATRHEAAVIVYHEALMEAFPCQ